MFVQVISALANGAVVSIIEHTNSEMINVSAMLFVNLGKVYTSN